MLYSQTSGSGEDLVLLHGWGFSADLFADLVAKYQHKYRLTVIDLPGHGRSDEVAGGAENWCAEIINNLPTNPILLGWSLGGLLAISIARQLPLKGLILVACSPNFIQNKHWNFGIPADNFRQFNTNLKADFSKGLRRFVSLQSNNKKQIKALNQSISRFPASTQALNQGLEILLNTNLLDEFQQLKIPIKVILGENDTLVPSQISAWYKACGVDVKILKTGHLPFLDENFQL
ncbi:MAG: alpha/beta fold hydrolase [Candidatus Thioglobus sp.]|nr:alpha/beta fold hydrolase [Candidatus Thioglobus sp.]